MDDKIIKKLLQDLEEEKKETYGFMVERINLYNQKMLDSDDVVDLDKQDALGFLCEEDLCNHNFDLGKYFTLCKVIDDLKKINS